jgi:hypothetical protein
MVEGRGLVPGDHDKMWPCKIAEGVAFEALLEELGTIGTG